GACSPPPSTAPGAESGSGPSPARRRRWISHRTAALLHRAVLLRKRAASTRHRRTCGSALAGSRDASCPPRRRPLFRPNSAAAAGLPGLLGDKPPAATFSWRLSRISLPFGQRRPKLATTFRLIPLRGTLSKRLVFNLGYRKPLESYD